MDGLAIWTTSICRGDYSFIYREGEVDGFSAIDLEEVFMELEHNFYENGIIEDRSNEYPIVPKEFVKWMD